MAIGAADDTIDWPIVEERVQDLEGDRFILEPGESTSILIDFFLPSGHSYQVYSWVDCGKQYKELYWDVTTIISIPPQGPEVKAGKV